MKQVAVGLLCWFIPTLAVWAAIILLPFNLSEMFFYPRNGWNSLAVAFLCIATPCCVASGLTLFLASAQKPTSQTLLWSVGSTFVIIGIVFTIWLSLIQVVGSSSFERSYPKLTFMLVVVAFLLPILTFLFLPLTVVHEHRTIVKGPWWPALLAILGLPAIMMIVTLVSGTIVARLVADLAASMGGHYHTWLNATDPGNICAIAIASTVLVSLRWSKELNKAQVPLQAGK